MKERLLYATIFILVGITVAQWTMPSGEASVVTQPAGAVVAAEGSYALAVDGSIWDYDTGSGWTMVCQSPVPTSNIQFFHGLLLTDTSGDLWLYENGTWTNRGQPPVAPLPTSKSTIGGVKAKYR